MPSPGQILYSTQSAGHWVTAGGSHWQLCCLLNNSANFLTWKFFTQNISNPGYLEMPWKYYIILLILGKFAYRRMWILVGFTTSQSPHFPILHFVQNLLHYITFSLEGEFGNVCSRKYQRISITHLHGQHSENHFSESVFIVVKTLRIRKVYRICLLKKAQT